MRSSRVLRSRARQLRPLLVLRAAFRRHAFPAIVSSALALAAPAGAVSLAPGDLVALGVTAGEGSGLHRVDPVTGATSLIAAGPLSGPFALGAGQSIYVAAGGQVSRLDAETGVETVVSSGGPLANPVSLLRRSDGQLFALDRDPAPDRIARLIQIDPTTGAQTVVADGGLFAPFDLADAAVDFALHGDARALVGLYGAGGFWVDLTTGLQTPAPIGAYLNDLEISPDGQWIYRVDTIQGESVHRLDAITLSETPTFDLEDAPGIAVEDVWYPADAVVEADGRVVVAGSFLLGAEEPHLVRWSPEDGSFAYLALGNFSQVAVVPAPEPGVAMLLLFGVAALSARRARRRG